MEQEWAKRVRQRLDDLGMTMKAASLKAGFGESFVRDMLERGRVPSIDKFQKLAAVLRTPVSELLGDDAGEDAGSIVPIMGYVGAGAEVEPDFEQIPEAGLEQIEVPFPMPADMIALQVKGESMLPQFADGMVIVVYRDQRRATESFFGEQAVVKTVDGKRYIKTIERGYPGVTLRSWNAKPIENVHLDWIGEIFTYFPASSIRRVSRTGGLQGRLKLTA